MTAEKQTADKGAQAQTEARNAAPLALLAIAWLIPGAGHWILGKRLRAGVFAVVIVAAFITGFLLDGELGSPKPGDPFSWLATFACLGNGILYLVRMIWINGLGGFLGGIPFNLAGGGNPAAAGFAYGNTFLYTAGLMNLLTVLDVSDIARGEKS